MGSKLTGDDQRILERAVEVSPSFAQADSESLASPEDLVAVFEIERTVKIIQDRGFSKVTLP